MSVRLISHASVLIEANGMGILTDPWQAGTAFNDSWKLLIEPDELAPLLDRIDYLWISHEHPDHFHIPTLKGLPEAFRQRVTVLFQRSSDHEKMVAAFTNMLGFPKVVLLPHRAWVRLDDEVEVYCYQSRQIDSALAVRAGGATLLDLNDCEASAQDLALLRRDLGAVDVLLNQFSIAGFDGVEARLPEQAAGILDNMVRDHRALAAKVTIPFASFVYFCCPDNRMINSYANTPGQVAERFAREGLDLAVLRPGDSRREGEPHDNGPALAFYADLYAGLDRLPIGTPPVIGLEALAPAFHALRAKLKAAHGRLGLRLLKPVTVGVPDLDLTLRLSFRDDSFETAEGPADLEIASQPLFFMLANNFGLQTLGVSGRYRLHGGFRNWFRHRTLLAMLNAGLGLAPARLLSRRQLGFLWSRRKGLLSQLRYRIRRAATGAKPA